MKLLLSRRTRAAFDEDFPAFFWEQPVFPMFSFLKNNVDGVGPLKTRLLVNVVSLEKRLTKIPAHFRKANLHLEYFSVVNYELEGSTERLHLNWYSFKQTGEGVQTPSQLIK